MIFFKVRFYEPNGDYKCTVLRFNVPSLLRGVEAFDAFAAGVLLTGDGRKVLWDSVHGLNPSENQYFVVPDQIDDLAIWLGPIKRKGLTQL